MPSRAYTRLVTALDRPLLLGVTFLSYLRRWLLGRHAIGVVYESQNGTLISGVGDMFVGRHLGFEGRYETDMLSSLMALVGPDSRVLVLGSHVGALAIPLSRKVRELVAYEANPETYRFLRYNILLNNIENITAYNLAVGDRAGNIEFLTSKVNSGGSGRRFDQSSHLQLERYKPIEVEMVCLSQHNQNPRFDFVLMDIEGSEYLALQGMTEILQHCNYLQFEYLPTALKGSGLSDRDYVSALGERFSEIRVQGTDIVVQRTDFLRFFERLRAAGQRVDLLASAASTRAPQPAQPATASV